MALLIVLKVLHITFAALLVGGSLGSKKSVENVIDVGGPPLRNAAEMAAKRGQLTGIMAVLTLLSGVALMFVSYGGFAGAPLNFHTALSVMLLAIGVSFGLMRPSWRRVVEQARGEKPDRETIRKALKRTAMGQGILHSLWLALLVLMYLRF